jgi:mitogen-activated protein kinase kinase
VHLRAAADCGQEIRLELDESKLNGIIMELDILHRAVAPEIVEFFGAFTIESCVYYCMEFMDAGSLDTLTGGGVPAKNVTEDTESAELRVPEPVLRRITAGIVRGLKFLKDELQIMHRGESALLSGGTGRGLIIGQMSSPRTCSSTRRVKSSCATLGFQVSWRRVWRRPTSAARVTWL